MEKNLIVIMSVIFVILLILAILQYGFKVIFKTSYIKPSFNKPDLALPKIEPEQKTAVSPPKRQREERPDSNKDYRTFIERTKDDYKDFMDKVRTR